MPVNSTHPTHAQRRDQWRKCRDAFEGEDAIKAGGEKYLPKLSGQTDADYESYKRRALFYSITSKSVAALVGMATSRPAKTEYPKSMERFFKGSTITQFNEVFSTLLQEVLLQSRVGILTDIPVDGGDPYPVIYAAEDIINWRVDEKGDIQMVIVREIYEDFKPTDIYEVVHCVRYRELCFEPDPETGKMLYVQKVYEQDEFSVPVNIFRPTIRGKRLEKIPFMVLHPNGVGFVDTKPLMLDIANINISHYMSSADLEHGRHFTGLPTPVVIGAESDAALYIGSAKFLCIPNPQGDAKYLEFTGQGLQSLEKAMTEKQSLLASLSARLLDNSSRGSESTDAVKLRYASETSSLTTVVVSTNYVLNWLYKTIAEISIENPDDVKIELDTDFMETQLSAAEMTALFDGFFKGAISKQTLVFNMRKGRRLDPEVTDAQEISAIGTPVQTQQTNTSQTTV